MRSNQPKVLHPLLGRPLVHFPVVLAQSLGIPRIVVVVGHGREAVEASVRTIASDAHFAVQAQQRGTADAVLSAEEATRGYQDVLILSGDVPGLRSDTIQAMAAARTQAQSPLALLTFVAEDPTGYGRAITNEAGRLLQIVEHRDANREQRAVQRVNAGIYLVDRAFLFDALSQVGTANAQNEFYLTDIAQIAADRGTPGVILDTPAAEVEGINNRQQLAALTQRHRRDRNETLMLEGVTMLDPDRTWVEHGVTLASDVTLHADVTLRGATSVGTEAVIQQGAVIEDSVIGAHALIKPYCVLSEATVGEHAAVGPFAHLRPGTTLHEHTKVGNFVETKKATLGPGSKASHLTYLGDCELGQDVNIGAGTITCNYDGVDKHRTVIEDRVFVGSNTEIVAPARIGAESVIGAGTTVTGDVPPGALAISRSPQKNVKGWALRAGPVQRKKMKKKES
jgi:bifunctional UDP-N-acetylglucosamine pyrophosphorylase/glucosamine-1-phosphate N-acetyltransferase